MAYIYIYIYIYIYSILGPVKPKLGVIPSGQEIIHEWIFEIFLVKSFLSKRSEEVLLIFFRVFGNFKNA